MMELKKYGVERLDCCILDTEFRLMVEDKFQTNQSSWFLPWHEAYLKKYSGNPTVTGILEARMERYKQKAAAVGFVPDQVPALEV